MKKEVKPDGGGDLFLQKTERIIHFGVGRRRCLGEILARAEQFLILTSLLQVKFMLSMTVVLQITVYQLSALSF